MKAFCKPCLLLFLSLMFTLSVPLAAMAEEGQPPEGEQPEMKPATELTDGFRFEISGHVNMRNLILDASLNQAEPFHPYERFYVYWDAAKVLPGYFCIQWDTESVDAQLWQLDSNGSVLSQRDVPYELDTVEKLLPDTRKVAVVAGRSGMSIIRLAMYSEGILPEPFVNWKPTPDHLDYLIVSTHPDDDVIFMGGVIPIYGVERGYVGTVAYVTSPSRMRINEALMGAWAMGTPYKPVFIGFQDISPKNQGFYANRFLPEAVTLALVRLFRAHRPLVVFTQDVNGEYGHWQHRIVSASVVEAARLAADEAYDPVSLAKDGAWQVQKCYVHLYPENPLVMDVNAPLASLGGRTALEVARYSFQKHKSQQSGRHWVQSDTDKHPMSRFGMAYGTVEAGNDVFDNIDPQLLCAALSAETGS